MARRVQVKGPGGKLPGLAGTVTPTNAVAGATPPPKTNSMLELSKALAQFNPNLNKFLGSLNKSGPKIEEINQQVEETGGTFDSMREDINQAVRSGDIQAGESPSMALGLVEQKNKNVVVTAKASLLSNAANFSNPETPLGEAIGFMDNHISESLGGVLGDPVYSQRVRPEVEDMKLKFIDDVIKYRTEAFNQEATKNINARVAEVSSSFLERSFLEDSGDEEAQLAGLSESYKGVIDDFRNMGFVDTNIEFAKSLSSEALRLAKEDPDTARDLLETASNLDVTGRGGLLGKVNSVSEEFARAELGIHNIELEQAKIDETLDIEREDELAGVFEAHVRGAIQEGRPLDDSELRALNDEVGNIYHDDLETGSMNINKLIKSMNNGPKQSKVNLEHDINSYVQYGDVKIANKLNLNNLIEGNITPKQFIENQDKAKELQAVKDVCL